MFETQEELMFQYRSSGRKMLLSQFEDSQAEEFLLLEEGQVFCSLWAFNCLDEALHYGKQSALLLWIYIFTSVNLNINLNQKYLEILKSCLTKYLVPSKVDIKLTIVE